MKISVEHAVYFHLEPEEQFVVTYRHTKGYALVDAITVKFLFNNSLSTWAGGIVCKKDGTLNERWGKFYVTVDLPSSDPWIELALESINGGLPLDSW